MSDNERDAEHGEENHPVLGRMGTSADPAAQDAVRERAENFTHTAPEWKPRTDTTRGPVPPADRLAHLGHIEHPTETWPMLKTIDMDQQGPAEEWTESFTRTEGDKA